MGGLGVTDHLIELLAERGVTRLYAERDAADRAKQDLAYIVADVGEEMTKGTETKQGAGVRSDDPRGGPAEPRALGQAMARPANTVLVHTSSQVTRWNFESI
jgi:sulfite reductase beta subunit-like hemoprotein